MGLIHNINCWKCKDAMGTFLHAVWECPVVLPFWKEVLVKLGEWVEQSLSHSPQLVFVGTKHFCHRV